MDAERVLVIAPHPDDEVLGTGGTIARYVDEGREVYVAIVTRGDPSMFKPATVERVRREATEAHQILGIRKTIFLDGFPAALLDTVPHSRLNAALTEVIEEVEPGILFVPYYGDLHLDHRLVFDSAMVAARPGDKNPTAVYAYETLSETNWSASQESPGFAPTTYVDISRYLERKLEAMSAYRTQLKDFPHSRSLEAVRALAQLRGATVGFAAAEAFVLIRSIEPLENHS